MAIGSEREGGEPVGLELIEARLEAEHLRRALETTQRLAHLGTWEYALPEGTIYWSSEMFRLYGYEPGEVVPVRDTAMDRTHPDDHVAILAWYNEMAAHPGEEREVDMRILLPDGRERPIVARAVLLVDERVAAALRRHVRTDGGGPLA